MLQKVLKDDTTKNQLSSDCEDEWEKKVRRFDLAKINEHADKTRATSSENNLSNEFVCLFSIPRNRRERIYNGTLSPFSLTLLVFTIKYNKQKHFVQLYAKGTVYCWQKKKHV